MKLIPVGHSLVRASICVLVLLLSVLSLPGYAQEDAAKEVASAALTEEFIATADATLARIDESLRSIELLELTRDDAEGTRAKLIDSRIRKLWAGTLEDVTSLARSLAKEQEQGRDISAYLPTVGDYMASLPSAIEKAALTPRVSGTGFPEAGMSAAELAVQNAEFFLAAEAFDDTSWALKRAIDAADKLGIDTAGQKAYLIDRVTNLVEGVIVYLNMSMNELASQRAAKAVLPDDAEVKAKVSVAERRVQDTAAMVENNLPILEAFDIETSHYSQEVVAATGQVSADVLDVGILSSLLLGWGLELVDTLKIEGPELLFQLFLFLLILFIFFKLAALVRRLVEKAMSSSNLNVSALLRRMVSSTTYNGVIVIGVLMALSQVGISLGPVLTGLGIAGFIIGFALQDSLANFASGMLILIYRPYDVEDMVEVSGVFGKVERMSLVNTTILTLDNQTLIVPNNKIWQDVIKNLTYQHIRRVDMEFGVSYDQDIDVAERVLNEVVAADERVLKDPETNIRVHALGDSSVNFIVRPWVKTDDYWDVFWDITKQVKQRFDAEGISIPFPQRDVHLYAGDPAAREMVANMTGDADDRAATSTVDNDAPSDGEDG